MERHATYHFSGITLFCLWFSLYFVNWTPQNSSSILICEMIRRSAGGVHVCLGGGRGAVEIWKGLYEVWRWGRRWSLQSLGEHTISMATVWSFSRWLSGSQRTRWQSGQVVLMTRGGEGRSILGSEAVVGAASTPPALPSADPKSCFDWISHELMRQAWRTASVVEISYHILICFLCERVAAWSYNFFL